MKNTCVYHLCVSCKKGLMFRGRRDYIRFINNMALLAYKYHIRILAFAVMSNHYHIGIMTDQTITITGTGPACRVHHVSFRKPSATCILSHL